MKKLTTILLALILTLSFLPALPASASGGHLLQVWSLNAVSFLTTEDGAFAIDETRSPEESGASGGSLRLNPDSTMTSTVNLNELTQGAFDLPFTIDELDLTQYTSYSLRDDALRLFPGGVSLALTDEGSDSMTLTYTGRATVRNADGGTSDVAMVVTLMFGPDATQTMMNSVIQALGEAPYRAVYDALLEGDIVQKGTINETARGLQQTLVAFGQNISVDGNVGAKTIGALNAVQAAFGLPQTDAVDAAVYAQLLPRLLIATEPDRAEELLADTMEEGEYTYNLACSQELKGLNYSAMLTFQESTWGDALERAEACVKECPKNGQLWRNHAISGSGVELTVKRNGSDDTAMMVKIYNDRDELVATLFVGGTGKATTYLPSGTFVIKDGVGKNWYGTEEAFGLLAYYEIMTFSGGEQSVKLQSGHAYTITINVQDSDPDGDKVGSEWESWGSF